VLFMITSCAKSLTNTPNCFPVSPWLMSRGAGETIPQHYEKNQSICYTLQAASVLHCSESVPLCFLCSRDHARIQGSFSFCSMRGGKCLVCFRDFPCQLFLSTLTHHHITIS
jgi:hypothetical protein